MARAQHPLLHVGTGKERKERGSKGKKKLKKGEERFNKYKLGFLLYIT